MRARAAATLELKGPAFSRRMLDVSSAHIPLRTAKLLDWQDVDVDECPVKEVPEPEAPWMHLSYSRWTDDGWIFHVSEEQARQANGCGHPELAALIALAREGGFDLLRLDHHADPIPEALGLPIFEW